MLGEHYLLVCIVLGSSVEKGYKLWVFFPGVCLGLLISMMGSLNTSAYHFGQISPSNFYGFGCGRTWLACTKPCSLLDWNRMAFVTQAISPNISVCPHEHSFGYVGKLTLTLPKILQKAFREDQLHNNAYLEANSMKTPVGVMCRWPNTSYSVYSRLFFSLL